LDLNVLGLPDSDLLVRGTNPDHSIINKKKKKNHDSYCFVNETVEIKAFLTFFLIMDPDPQHWFLNIHAVFLPTVVIHLQHLYRTLLPLILGAFPPRNFPPDKN
jgi:hypothetical protein